MLADLLCNIVLQPGDCVILNAANSTVGQLLVQLCRLLQLRCVAVVRDNGNGTWDRIADWLKSLGASEVIADQKSVKVRKRQQCAAWHSTVPKETLLAS